MPLGKLLPYLSPYKLRILAILIALLVSSLTTLSMGPGLGLLIDSGLLSGNQEHLAVAVWVILMLAVLLGLATCARYYNVSWLGERVSADIRNKVFQHLLRLNPQIFELSGGADLQSRFTTDTTVLQSVIGSSVSIALRNFVIVAGGIVAMLILNPVMAIVAFLMIPALVVPVVIFGRRIKMLSRLTQAKVGEVGAEISEVVRHIKTVQAFNRQDYHKERFSRGVEASFEAARSMIWRRSVLVALVIILSMSALGFLVVIGAWQVATEQLTAGDIIAFIFIAFMVAGAMAMISEVSSDLIRASGAMERLMDILAIDATERMDIEVAAKTEINRLEGDTAIQIDNLVFAYPQRPLVKVLDGLSLSIPVGGLHALVGLSGAGKTTIFDLLLRFYAWQQGEIRIGGQDICRLPVSQLRRLVGSVRQEPPLFRGSIWDNIAYGAQPDAEGILDEKVREVAHLAYIDEFSRHLPDGLMTQVGEAGVTLSAGQRQRIAIARTLLADPMVLLLDEVTSHLDAESEAMIQDTVARLAQMKTVLVVAHRLSTVVSADCIYILKGGRMITSGKHDELMDSTEAYRRLVRLQFSEQQSVQPPVSSS